MPDTWQEDEDDDDDGDDDGGCRMWTGKATGCKRAQGAKSF